MNSEPAVIIGLAVSLIGALTGAMPTFGLLTADQAQALGPVIAAFIPLVQAVVTRSYVSPLGKISEGGTLSAAQS